MKSKGVFRPVDIPGHGRVLAPVDNKAAEIARTVKKDVMVHVHAPRNPAQHRQVWALASILAENLDGLHDAEDAMNLLKVEAKHIAVVKNPRTGNEWIQPKSIAFESCDQVHFQRLYDRFIWIICNELLPEIDEKAVRDKVHEIMDGELGRRVRSMAA